MSKNWIFITGLLIVGFVTHIYGQETFRSLPDLSWEQRSDWLNVKDFGAKGDGSSDDTEALQEAFDRLDSGVTIYLPEGDYRIRKTLEWKNPQRRLTGTAIIGHGEKTRLIWDGADGGRMIKDSGLSLCRYMGIVFDGRNKASVGMWNDQEAKFETQVRYRCLAFRNLRAAGILSEDNEFDRRSDSEPTFDNCIFDNVGTGIRFSSYNDYDFTFKSCLFINNQNAGIDCRNGNFYVLDSRFENNGTDIKVRKPEHGFSVRRSVSCGSERFIEGFGGVSPLTIDNCTISNWKSPDGAIQYTGALLAFNNTFLPSEKIQKIMKQYEKRHVFSGNRHPSESTENTVMNDPAHVTTIPAGKRPPLNLRTDANFLAENIRIPEKIFDAKRDFGAVGNGKKDDTDAIQKTINAAKQAGNNAMAYLPSGIYRINRTLLIDGENYFIGGSGSSSVLAWCGKPEEHALEIRSPRNLVIENLRISNVETISNPRAAWNGEKGANILQYGSPSPSTILYDGVFVYGKYQPAGSAERQGILFRDLNEHDIINLYYLEGNQRYENAGNGIVLGSVCHEGSITVDGVTGTGFLGGMTRLATHTDSPLHIRKNASFIWPDFYLEQGFDLLLFFEGTENTPEGRVTLGHPKFARAPNNKEENAGGNRVNLIRFNGYRGTVNLMGIQFYPNHTAKEVMIQSNGKNRPILNIIAPYFYNSTLVFEQNLDILSIGVSDTSKAGNNKFDSANSPERYSLVSTAFDDCTLLGELDLQINYPTKKNLR